MKTIGLSLLALLTVSSWCNAGPRTRARDGIAARLEARDASDGGSSPGADLTSAEKKALRFLRKHPVASGKALEKAQDNPSAAKSVVEFAKEHPGISRTIARFGDDHPGVAHNFAQWYVSGRPRPSTPPDGDVDPPDNSDDAGDVTHIYYPPPYYYPYPYNPYPVYQGPDDDYRECPDRRSSEKSPYVTGELYAKKPRDDKVGGINSDLFRQWLIVEQIDAPDTPTMESAEEEKWLRLTYPGDVVNVESVAFFTEDENRGTLNHERVGEPTFSFDLRVDRLTTAVGITVKYKDSYETTIRFPYPIAEELIGRGDSAQPAT